ncbi:MAG TPA: dihydrodipicolinate synthase family protein [Longimicrobiales bacterium]|nr:dihydrodipicolinate synthase family protein [Longimicrobiales bacterium]
MTIDLKGTFLPITTPFDAATGDVDLGAFRANLRAWFAHPIRGVLVAGSTGEAVYLDDGESAALLEATREEAPEGRLILMGTGAESTRATIKKTKKAAAAGADAVLVKPPVFYKAGMTPEALVRHFQAVADASPIPLIVYQVPLRLSTLEFPIPVVTELAKHPNIVGMKDSRGDLAKLGELVQACPPGFQVVAGAAATLLGGLELGAVGGIVAAGLFAPAECAEISVAFYGGRKADAAPIQERMTALHVGIVGGTGVPGIKVAMDLVGLRGGDPRPPLLPVPQAKRDEIRGLLQAGGIL